MWLIIAVFLVTYIGMALGRAPGLRMDRSAIAVVAERPRRSAGRTS